MSSRERRSPTGTALSLTAVAELAGATAVGDSTLEVTAVAPVDQAAEGELAFLASRRYTRFVPDCKALAYLVSSEFEEVLPEEAARVVVDDAYPALRAILRHFHPEDGGTPGIHPTAVLGANVEIGVGVEIGPYAVLEDGVRLGDGSRVGAHCVLGRGSEVGEGCRLHPHAVLYHETILGSGCIIHSGARLGSDGFGYTVIDGEHVKMPQVGRCVIDDDVEIGANTTVDRGSLGDTRVERGVKLDNLVHVAHNATVGARSLMAALSGVAGSTRMGKGVWLGGQAGIINNLDIGDGVRIAVKSGVLRDVKPGETVSGTPARPHRDELKRQALVARLPKLIARVKALEKEIETLRDV